VIKQIGKATQSRIGANDLDIDHALFFPGINPARGNKNPFMIIQTVQANKSILIHRYPGLKIRNKTITYTNDQTVAIA
jgi:hypothetical protein